MMSASAYGSSTETRDSGAADLFKNGSGSSNFGFRISVLFTPVDSTTLNEG